MQFGRTLVALGLAFAVGSAWSAVEGVADAAVGYENPVWPEDSPDPTVWNGGDGNWYSSSTCQRILKSRDLVHWEDTGKSLLEESEVRWIKSQWPNIWAPDVVKIGEWYNLYLTYHNTGAHTAIAAYRSKNPTGPFVDRTIIVRSEGNGKFEVIDPEVVVDPETKRTWLFFGHGDVRRVELTADGRAQKPGAAVEHVAGWPIGAKSVPSGAPHWLVGSSEGAYLHRRGGKWYLFVSQGNWADHTYQVAVGRADRLDGVFVDRQGHKMADGYATPILTSGKDDEFFGPGHNGEIFTSKSGRDYMFYHCHWKKLAKQPGGYCPRPMFLQEIFWDADGWPYFKNGGKPQKTCEAGFAVAAGAVSAEVPFNALRFGSEYTTPSNWPGMREALTVNRGAFDEVWFSTGVTFPPLSWHEERARQCAQAAADLRRLGIVPSIEIQTIIGHTDAILSAGDCRGQDWSTWVGCDGTVSKHVSCPRDPRLAAYFAKVGELHAVWKPGSVWVDDDVTLRNRAPMKDGSKALFGCFCDRCLADFSKAEGRTWSRSALAEAIRAGGGVDARWEAFHVEGMARLCRTIAAAVHRVSPETVFGYQYGYSGRVGIPKGLHDGSGMPVRLRPGAGAYWDTDPHAQLGKAYELARLSEMFGYPDWIEARCPEIESCPRTFSCRTPQGIVLEAFENLALGMDFLSMFVADVRGGESTDYYRDRLFPRIAAAQGFLRAFRDANRGARPCGFAVEGGEPPKLIACRGVPITTGRGQSLGPLPDVNAIPVRMAGSGDVTGRGRQVRVMQIAAGPALLDFYRRCDEASGGRLPVRFEEPVMAFAMPNVRADGTLATLAIVNASIDRQEATAVRLRGVPAGATKGVWHVPEGAAQEIALERAGTDVRAVLPRLGAWQCGYLSFGE